MRFVRTPLFKRLYARLGPSVQARADDAFRGWVNDTTHPGLNFEKVDDERDMWFVRVGRKHRALCMKADHNGETYYVWFWIGAHDQYERLIAG